MNEEEIKTLDDIEGKEEEQTEPSIEEKYNKLSIDHDELIRNYEAIKEKYQKALEANNQLYKRITVGDPSPAESETEKLLKNYK